LQAAVLVDPDHGIAGEHAAQANPARPAVIGRGLCNSPQSIVAGSDEGLQAAIGVACDGNFAVNATSYSGPLDGGTTEGRAAGCRAAGLT
jgi:hypothetical protein